MADQNLRPRGADADYEETTAPQNPPNSMIRPEARTSWLASSLGTLMVIFLIIAAVFTWVAVQRSLGKGDEISPDPGAIGTSGERQPREGTPGGFNPTPRPRSTKDELESRGAGEPARGPMPGLTAQELTTISDVRIAAAGQRVVLEDMRVDRADGDTFWIRDGDDAVAVVAPGGTPTVKAGQKVNVAGTVERIGSSMRIRASRIDVL